MTFPITDEQLKRAVSKLYERTTRPTTEDFRAALEAALDRRVGDKDRRKVNDGATAYKNGWNRGPKNGRRVTDVTCFTKLPNAEPPIQVSEGMKKAGADEHDRWCDDDSDASLESGVARIYRAMEAKRIEEQKAKPMVKHFGEVTLSGESAKRGNAPCGAELYARWHRDRWVNVTNERSGRDRRKGGK